MAARFRRLVENATAPRPAGHCQGRLRGSAHVHHPQDSTDHGPRLTRYLAAQRTQIDGVAQPLFAGVWAIFGHGNIAVGEALHGARAHS